MMATETLWMPISIAEAIDWRRLTRNIPDAFVVATPLLTPDGNLIAAISAAVDDDAEGDRLDDLGEELEQAGATLGPKYWPQARINGARRRR
jgi:hypothetical protein